MDKIKILKVEPGKPPCVKEIANDFKASQAEVEGDIECVGFGDGCVAVINAEGKLNGMQPNRRNGDDIICGPFFICGDSPDGDFISLTEQQIEEYTRRFGEIEQSTGRNRNWSHIRPSSPFKKVTGQLKGNGTDTAV